MVYFMLFTAPTAAAIVLSQPRSGAAIAIAKPAHLSSHSTGAAPSPALGIPAAIGVLPAPNVGSSGNVTTPLGSMQNRSLPAYVPRPQSGGLSLVAPPQRFDYFVFFYIWFIVFNL